MRLTLTTAPSTVPVDLASAKQHCRVEHADDDTLIEGFISAATRRLDRPTGILGRAIMPQVWLLELAGWQDTIVLPVEPVRSVAVAYTDPAGATQTLDPAAYSLTAWPSEATEWSFLSDAARPALGDVQYPVRVTIAAGYADAAAVPEELKVAIKMMVGHWYNHREAVATGAMAEVPLAVGALIAPFRRLI